LWGKDTRQTEEILKSELGRDVEVACIGPSGEKLSLIAAVFNRTRTAARSGLGAVMGSKKLKAIVIRGTGRVVAASPEALQNVRKGALDMTLVPIAYSGGEIPELNIGLMPGVVTSYEQGMSWKKSEVGKLLTECVQVIMGEAGSLKNLVDEFSRFARLPEARLEETDLHRILENALSLYDGRIQGISVHREFDSAIPMLRLDPEHADVRVLVHADDYGLVLALVEELDLDGLGAVHR
jgi:signal transduction histidine kinase